MLTISKHEVDIKLGDRDVNMFTMNGKLYMQSKEGDKQICLDFVSKNNLKGVLDLLQFLDKEYYNESCNTKGDR